MDQDAALMPAAPAPLAPVPPAQPSALRKVFIGKDGLRAGWSLLIYVVMLVAIGFCVTFIVHKFHPQPTPAEMAKIAANMPPRFLLLNELIPFLIVFLVTWIMSKIERRPNSVYGFGGSRKLLQFFAGLAWGVFCLSLLVLILWKAGLLVIDSRLLFGSDVLRYGLIWLFGFFLVGLFEEYLLRGYLQYTLSRGLTGLYQAMFKSAHSAALGFWTAALLLSTLFGSATARTLANLPSACSLPDWPGCFSVSPSGVLVRSGGPSASTPRGIGRNPFSTVWPIAG